MIAARTGTLNCNQLPGVRAVVGPSSLMVLKILAILALSLWLLLAAPQYRRLQPAPPLSFNLLVRCAAWCRCFRLWRLATASFVAGEIREPRKNLPRAL